MNLAISVSLPFLWGGQVFEKNEWGFLNFLVGPNGTGKTLFTDQLRQQCQVQGLKPRYLNAERLSGMEKSDSSFLGSYNPLIRGMDIAQLLQYKQGAASIGLSLDAFFTLKEKLDVRVRIEANLSQLFGRRIRLAEEGGFLKPKMQMIDGGDEYGLKESESHGLKELITLLTFLYDDEYDCLIVDEPELHLHPQFQAFFLQEARKIAGDPRIDASKKCFFLITHSPYFIDIRTTEELRHCVVFQQNKVPAYVDALDTDDEWTISRAIPRLNTHHKQFFFASRPIFVEGYYDQQLFTLIQEKRGIMLGASGTSIIDVSGKDELDLFFRLCNKLKIDAQFIADLDLVVHGKLRQSVSHDERCKAHLQAEGMGEDLMTPLGQMERQIDECLKVTEPASSSAPSTDPDLRTFFDVLGDATKIEEKRYVFLLALRHLRPQIEALMPEKLGTINFINGRLMKLVGAFERCGVHLLPNGELENHLLSYNANPFKVTDKAKQVAFKEERDLLLSSGSTEEQIKVRYAQLITVLDKASRSTIVNMDKYLSYTISDWIHNVQSAFRRGEIVDLESLRRNALVQWSVYSRIMEVMQFSATATGFTCTAKLKPLVDQDEREVAFDSNTVPAGYELTNTDR